MDKFEKIEAQAKKRVGGLFLVPVHDNMHVYGHYLEDSTFAFYDFLTDSTSPNLAEIVSKPVLFRTNVMWLVFTQKDRKWKKIGHHPIPTSLQSPAIFCRENVTSRYTQDGEFVYDYYLEKSEILTPISEEECAKLEPSAVWNPLHIQERLRKHYGF